MPTLAQSFSGSDAFGLILTANEACGDDITPVCLTNALNNLAPYEGFQGTLTLSADTHQPVGLPMAIMTIKDGAPQFVQWYTPEGPAK